MSHQFSLYNTITRRPFYPPTQPEKLWEMGRDEYSVFSENTLTWVCSYFTGMIRHKKAGDNQAVMGKADITYCVGVIMDFSIKPIGAISVLKRRSLPHGREIGNLLSLFSYQALRASRMSIMIAIWKIYSALQNGNRQFITIKTSGELLP